MPYDTNIPRATDNLNVSQGDIQGNFLTANTVMGINHYPFTDATIGGKHKFVDMPILAALPSIAAGDGGLYTKTVSSQSQLFYAADGNITEYQMTRVIPASVGTFAIANGWTFLPGGILMQWGTNTSASGSTITFPVAYTSAVFGIQCTIFQNTTNRHFVYTRSNTLTNFVTTQLDSGGSGETNTFFWTAIGI